MQENISFKSILVTGAAGLIGSAIVQRLLSSDIKVIACDNFSTGDWKKEGPLLKWENIDIADMILRDRLNVHSIDAVIHCAAHPGGRSLKEPGENVRINAFGSMQLFEWCAHKQIPIIYLSSSVVYGHQPPGLISEEAVLNPGTIYGVCKIACENFLRILGDGYGLKWTVLRLFATYGAGHRPSTFQGIVNIMLTQLLSGNKVVVKGSLDRKRDLIYVDDTVDAILKALFSDQSRGEVINIGTGVSVSIRCLIEEICNVLGRQLNEIDIIEQEGTVGDPVNNVGDCSKAGRILNFTPQFDLKEGLKEILNQRAGAQK